MPVVPPGGSHGGMKHKNETMDEHQPTMEGMNHDGMKKMGSMEEDAMKSLKEKSMENTGNAAAQ